MIINGNSKPYLMKRLKEIREEIPCSLIDQAEDLDICLKTIYAWIYDTDHKIALKHINIRKIKAYIKRYEESK